ncbi:putative gnat family protein [Rosellinia necatrix]|uniref:Putative gnat family protein n=1 Tax=Rosellinia necatrix TaxID=77044 RepID=A0A1W2TE47_ROSNE|nr:putative gnat family protein [Rosellinia necatrix]
MDAFSESDYTYWWGPAPAMWLWQEERIRRRFADPNTQQFKVVNDADSTIVAWAKWDPPPRMTGLTEGFLVYDNAGQPISAETRNTANTSNKDGEGVGGAAGQTSAKSYAQGPPEGSNIPLFNEFYDGLLAMEKKYQASEKLVLTHLCTRHTYQGRGLGSALLRSVLDLADREGLSAYLEASHAGAPLYQKLDFQVVDTLEFDRSETGIATPATLHVMVRKPRAV